MNHEPVLVTGGSGFIGAAVARSLAARGTPVVLFDLRPPAALGAGDTICALPFVAGDILDGFALARAIRDHKIRRILHTAAIVGAGLSIDSPVRTLTTNMQGLSNVLEAARSLALGRIVFISSQSVYGPGRYEPVDEGHPTDPDSPYGVTKLAGEKLGNVYAACYGVDFAALRMPHIYGPGRPSGLRGNVIQDMLEAAQSGRPFSMAAGGDQTKEPTHIDDVIDAVTMALDVERDPLTSRVYNASSGQVMTWRQVADIVRARYPQARLDLGPGPIVVRPGILEQVLGPLDCRRAAAELGYRSRFPVAAGIAHFADWLEARRRH